MDIKEKIKDLKFPIRKLIFTLIITCFSGLIISVSTVWGFSFLGFFIIFVSYFYCISGIDKKEDLFYFFIKTIKSLFFFLPIAAIFYTFLFTGKMVSSSSNSLDAWAVAVWWAIWWFMVIFLSLVIWLVWGFIIWMFAKKPKEEIKSRSIWILFLAIIILIFYYASSNNSLEISNNKNSSQIQSVNQTWNLEKQDNKKEENLSDKILFNLTSFNFVKWDYSNSFEISYDVENKSWKDIIWFEWNFEIYDIFNDKLWTFNLDKIGEFKNNEKFSEKSNYRYNQFLSEHTKLSKQKFEDLKFKYKINKIVFKDDFDSANKIFWKNTWKDIEKINYEILNKIVKKWDFSENLEFEVKVTNNSEKNIKWIKWGFSFYNIFWEKLWSYELNLTKDIKKWESLNEKLTFSVNQFISDEVELSQTDFSLLKYNFDIENVVYSE